MDKVAEQASNSISYLQRVNVVERASYEPTAPQEKFIVPLLRWHIEQVLSTYAKPISLNPRILDVGCGRQPFRKDLEAIGYNYRSIDAQQNPEESVDIVCEIDKPLPTELLSIDPFDFIFCTEVMEHVANWNIAFSNFAQLLVPGGRLFITCPHFYQLHEVPYDFWRPTPYALQYFGKQFGLKVIHQVNAGDAWDVLGTLLANCYSLPASQSFGDRVLNRIVSKCHQTLLQLLVSRRLQATVKLHSPLYLSNIIVFEK
jgi:SAM-dependent methyltransferase